MLDQGTAAGGLELDYADEESFLNSFLEHVDQRLNSGDTDIPVNLAGIVQLPAEYVDALESAVLAAEGAGARLWFFCTPEFSSQLEQLGKARSVPHEVVEPEVVDLPLEEQRASFELLDDWLIARAPDERAMIKEFQDNVDLMLTECDRVQIDLRKLPVLSGRFCKTLVLAAIGAREQGKPIKLRLTTSQQKALQKVPGAEFFDLSQEERRATTQQMERLKATSKRLRAVMDTARARTAEQQQGATAERRTSLRLRVENAFILYRLQGSSNKLKTRVVDLSEGGLAFYASEPIDARTSLSVYLEMPAFIEPPKVAGTVVRCEPVELKSGARAFRIGVQFVELPGEVGQGLKRTLQQGNQPG